MDVDEFGFVPSLAETINKIERNVVSRNSIKRKYPEFALDENGQPILIKRWKKMSLKDKVCYAKFKMERELLRVDELRIIRSREIEFSEEWEILTDDIILTYDDVDMYEELYKTLIC